MAFNKNEASRRNCLCASGISFLIPFFLIHGTKQFPNVFGTSDGYEDGHHGVYSDTPC